MRARHPRARRGAHPDRRGAGRAHRPPRLPAPLRHALPGRRALRQPAGLAERRLPPAPGAPADAAPRGARARGRQARPRRPRPRDRRPLPGGALGRHAEARRPRPRHRHRPGGDLLRRADLRARPDHGRRHQRPDPRAGRGDGRDRDHHHPRHDHRAHRRRPRRAAARRRGALDRARSRTWRRAATPISTSSSTAAPTARSRRCGDGQGARSYVCAACGAASAKWAGRCEACGAWNTMPRTSGLGGGPAGRTLGAARRRRMAVERPRRARAAGAAARASGIAELDRVLGGGLVPASAVLVGGDPGIGKSTLLLQAAAAFARGGAQAIYVSGEEAPAQVRMRAARLGLADAPLGLAAETNLRDILTTLEAERPDLAVIDSVQTMWADHVESAPGLGRPGARRGPRAHGLRQAARHGGRPGRPRHQGRPDRRPARRRAHGRHRALLRGRARAPVPHPARGQEPLRPGGRDRRLRDDRGRARRGGEPLGAVPQRARQPGLRLGRLRRDRGHPAAARRDAGAGRRRARSAPPGAPCSAGTPGGSPWCWRCWRRAAASASAASTSTSTSRGACASPSRRRTSRWRRRSSPPARTWPSRATPSSSARSASRARCAAPPRPRRGCARRRSSASRPPSPRRGCRRRRAPGIAIHPVADLPAFIEKCFGRIDR